MTKVLLNFSTKVAVDIISRGLVLITLPIIARTLSLEKFGIYNYIAVVLSYYGFFIEFGYSLFGVTEIIKYNNKNVVNQIISLQLITAIFSYSVLLCSAHFFFNNDTFILLLILAISFFFQPFLITYYYTAINKIYFISLVQLISQIVFIVLIISLFAPTGSLLILIIITTITQIIIPILLFIPYIWKNHLPLSAHR